MVTYRTPSPRCHAGAAVSIQINHKVFGVAYGWGRNNTLAQEWRLGERVEKVCNGPDGERCSLTFRIQQYSMMGQRVHLQIPSVFPVTLAFLFFPMCAKSEVLNFVCSWEHSAGINVSIDTEELTAFRDDGGASYKVMNITDKAIFLQVENPYSRLVAIQILERPAGNWHDIIAYDDGRVSAIAGGSCIEKVIAPEK